MLFITILAAGLKAQQKEEITQEVIKIEPINAMPLPRIEVKEIEYEKEELTAAVPEEETTKAQPEENTPEYIPSTEAAEGYISELELIEITEEIGNQYHVSPEMLQAMAERESRLYITAVNGNCTGLMQVSSYWHKDRAERLGVTDLYEPRGNILVATDYLAELFSTYGEDIYLVLMVYNMGDDKAKELYYAGTVSKYAKTITARAAELEELHGK